MWLVITTGVASCCSTLTFTGSPGDEETFECANGDEGCTSELTVTDTGGIINTYDNTITPPSGYSHYASIAFTTTGQEVNTIVIDMGSTDANYTLTYWYYVEDYSDSYTGTTAYGTETTTLTTDAFHTTHIHNSSTDDETISVIGDTTDSDWNVVEGWYKHVFYINQGTTSYLVIYQSDGETVDDTLTFTAGDYATRYITFRVYITASIAHTTRVTGIQIDRSGGGSPP